MRWILTVAVACTAFILCFRPAPATAGLHFCNKTNQVVHVSIVISDFLGASAEMSSGWWSIPAGGCKTPIGDDLSSLARVFYSYYAHNQDNSVTWAGDSSDVLACVAFGRKFEISSDNEPPDCSKKQFRFIDRASAKDYTLTLTAT
jgi:uncharacterized membrane protein